MAYELDRYSFEQSSLVVSRGDCGRDAELRDSPPCVEPPLAQLSPSSRVRRTAYRGYRV